MKNYEYEDRAMLTFEAYTAMLQSELKTAKMFRQIDIENIYLDDDNHTMEKNKMMLRIRRFNHNEELTLKKEGINGTIEINETIENHPEIQKEIGSLNNFKPIVKLQTMRIEIPKEGHLLVLDLNKYNHIQDYDFEIEAKDLESAKRICLEYCRKYHVEYKNDYLTKSSRAFHSLKC